MAEFLRIMGMLTGVFIIGLMIAGIKHSRIIAKPAWAFNIFFGGLIGLIFFVVTRLFDRLHEPYGFWSFYLMMCLLMICGGLLMIDEIDQVQTKKDRRK